MTSGSTPAPPPTPPSIAALAPDVVGCNARHRLTTGQARDLNAGEVEKGWKADRATAAARGDCLDRAICHVADIRREIAQVDDQSCPVALPPPDPRRS